ncbi:hypothetical protein [Variovorax sp. V116]|uniref:hypothetical protein n=1 Tax=Variovorax sp. V116 TaxID=3065953 RepID=UPI0034E86887
MNTEIPHLKIEQLENGCIRLENESVGDSYVVDIHPLHLRYMAEKLGLVREMSASEADALRTVDKLARRLRVLHERVLQLDQWLWEHQDATNADISVEIWYSAGTLDLSNEFQAEMAESRAVVTPRHAESRSATNDDPVPCAKPKTNPPGTQRVPRVSLAPQLDLGVGHE